MANGIWVGSVNDSVSRQAVKEARITVTDPATGNLLGLYKDRAGTLPIGNPFLTREDGLVKFFARVGRVNISAIKGNTEQIFENEIILDHSDAAPSDWLNPMLWAFVQSNGQDLGEYDDASFYFAVNGTQATLYLRARGWDVGAQPTAFRFKLNVSGGDEISYVSAACFAAANSESEPGSGLIDGEDFFEVDVSGATYPPEGGIGFIEIFVEGVTDFDEVILSALEIDYASLPVPSNDLFYDFDADAPNTRIGFAGYTDTEFSYWEHLDGSPEVVGTTGSLSAHVAIMEDEDGYGFPFAVWRATGPSSVKFMDKSGNIFTHANSQTTLGFLTSAGRELSGRVVIVTTENNQLCIYRGADMSSMVRTAMGANTGTNRTPAISYDGLKVAVVDFDGGLSLYSVPSSGTITKDGEWTNAHGYSIDSAYFTPNNQKLVVNTQFAFTDIFALTDLDTPEYTFTGAGVAGIRMPTDDIADAGIIMIEAGYYRAYERSLTPPYAITKRFIYSTPWFPPDNGISSVIPDALVYLGSGSHFFMAPWTMARNPDLKMYFENQASAFEMSSVRFYQVRPGG